jgi:Ca-activated chloride channel family protein
LPQAAENRFRALRDDSKRSDLMPFELTHPLFLFGLFALPFLAWYYRCGLTDFVRWQRLISLLLRSTIAILLVLSLAGFAWITSTREQFVVFATDESESLGPEAKEEATRFIDEALKTIGPNRAAFLRFAAEPGELHADRAKAAAPKDLLGTNLAAAIEIAAASVPPTHVPRIVLLTDGNQTAGDGLKAALRAGVPISTVSLPPRTDPEVQLTDVQVPAQVRDGEPFYVEVVVNSNHDDEGMIEVFRGAHKVIGEKLKIKSGENKFRFRQSVTGERLVEYTASVKDFRDKFLDNNSARGLVFTSGKPRVLLVESDPKLAKHLSWALEQEGILVDTRPSQGMPDSLADLQNYELLILSNVPATALSQQQMNVARTYVQDFGGGLIMLGGDQSFGLGGYYKTTIEEILPVRSDFEREKETPSLAMILVIDKSGSMGGQNIEMAKDAAKAAVELLGPKDKVGVIAFEGETFWVVDVQPAANRSAIIDKISTIEAGGGTVMAPAMEAAYEALQNTVAKLKHVIILTDGISSPGDFDGITQNMASARITVSAVGIGGDADEKLLKDIARIGNGRYYFTDDPAAIPQIFAKETVSASKSAINEQPFVPQVLRPTPVLSDIKFAEAPFLLGYVVTRPKPTSELVLITEKGDPLLAWWRYGLGMSVAFTSDAKSRWAAEWLTWPGYSKFWAQVVRHAMRRSDAKGTFVQTAQKDRKALVTLDAINPTGSYLNQAETELTVLEPDGSDRKLTMNQTAPGRYTAAFDIAKPGSYHMQLLQKSQGVAVSQQSRGLVVNYNDEFRLKPNDEALLEAIARASGGAYGVSASSVFQDSERAASRTVPLWPYFVTAAVLFFMLDVALRRIDFALLFGWRRPGPGWAPPRPVRAKPAAAV